jgi:hypothetical protein
MSLHRRLDKLEQQTRPRADVAHVHIPFVWMVPAGRMEWPVKIPLPPLKATALNPDSQ